MSQKLLAEYHEVRTTSSITLNQEDGKGHASTGQTYKPGYEPKLYCVNHGRVNAWKLGHGSSLMMQLWESDVDPSSKYILEQLSVKYSNQGWGNTSLNIACFAVVGEYMMEVASRALQDGERKLGTIDLVKDKVRCPVVAS